MPILNITIRIRSSFAVYYLGVVWGIVIDGVKFDFNDSKFTNIIKIVHYI